MGGEVLESDGFVVGVGSWRVVEDIEDFHGV